MSLRSFLFGSVASYASVVVYYMVTKDGTYSEPSPELASKHILTHGIPDRGPNIHVYDNHVLAYDQAKKTPIWVAERITQGHVDGPADRKNIRFKPDPEISTQFSADNLDYLRSGWSRGHMSPAGDNKHSQEAMSQSFYLSNIVPQNLENNAGFWNRLEMYCRELTQRYHAVTIFSGPLSLPSPSDNGKLVVTYPVIGKNQVAVPTHLYKVIIVEDTNSNPVAIGSFIVPNEPIGFEHALTEYQVPLDDVERKTGVTFTPKLDTSHLGNLCEIDSCKLMPKRDFDSYFIGRRLKSAQNRQSFEKAWNELEVKNIPPSQYHIDLYRHKMKEFEEKERKNPEE
ncbi:nuclease EXOG, mitochondrial-like [Mizuhopecten yessoensis]|uniref:Nuclease EXOG, mitochondrial n=1 Tax=Mizuhopecten yessoensis TaxID=6573 RepID=A0A210R5Q6_MIZYE|nr:nuclease EXOG, mitochondrial-like [Mizuhopecten yessoensis]OWF56352.1 Nuclease EXOG, mitochondrial [Mizuhopecten yessoensis]